LTELLRKPVNVEEILESEGNTSGLEGKVNRLDLKAKIDDGEIAVFEIQYFDQIDFLGKVLFNACKAVVEQVTIGEPFKIKKVYSINIAYYRMDAKDEYLFVAGLTEFKGVHFDEVIPFSQNLDPRSKVPRSIHPEYFLILPNKFKDELKSKFDEWVYVLKHSSVKSDFTAAGIQAAGEKLDVLKMTREQRAEYERNKIVDMSQKSQLYTAELKGEQRGLEKGEAIGLEKGRTEGEAIGLEKEKEQTVIRCHKKGYKIEVIAMITDLSHDQILKILSNTQI
jgi:predicted transposase/invertase (TIGR01784 family)